MGIASRRQFLKTVGTGISILVLPAVGPLKRFAFADPPTYKGVFFLTPAYRALRYGVTGFLDHLRKDAPDVLKIDFFDSGSLLKADEQVSALREGAIQFMFHATTYFAEEFPILGIIELPGVCQHFYEHGERLAMESPLWKLINGELARDNLFMLSVGSGIAEPEYLWSGRSKVVGLADLQGKRCRVVGETARELIESFGATVVRIPSADTYLALQRGSVDVVLATVNTVVGRNLHEQLRYCLQLPTTAVTIGLFFCKDTWEKMPGKERAAFLAAGKWYDENQGKTGYRKITQEDDWPVVRKAGIQVVQPTKAEEELFLMKARPVWESWKRKVGEEVGQRAIDLAMGIN